MKIAKRIMLLVVCTAAAFPVLSPVQPAWAGDRCEAYPSTPYMMDYKLQLVMAENLAVCELEMMWIRSEVELFLYSSRTATWSQVSHGELIGTNTRSVVAYTDTSCKGLGSNATYLARGMMRGSWNGRLDEDGQDGKNWGPSSKSFNCGVPDLRDIKP